MRQQQRVKSIPFVFAMVAIALLLPLPHSAQAAPHKVLDLRTSTDSDGVEREISFCSRPSADTPHNLPGHAFVAFSTKPRSQPRTYQALGFTTSASPAAAMLTYLKVVPSVQGYVKEENYSDAKEKCLVVQVNKDAYDRAWNETRAPMAKYFPSLDQAPPLLLGYRLGAEDCMTFMIDVAKKLGGPVKVPDRGAAELPLNYTRRLIDAN